MRHATMHGALVVLTVLAVLACGQRQMVSTTESIHKHVAAGRYSEALTLLRQERAQSYDEQDRVVYWLEEGMLLHLAGEHRASIASLERAERRTRELYTASISSHLEAAITSDAALDYAAEDYESVLANVIKALSFLALRDEEGAMVEARRINEKLASLSERSPDPGAAYREDAFAHWLMGMLFELEGSQDDARIAFVRAMEVYEQSFRARYGVDVPGWLAEDVARAALRSGELELAEVLRAQRGDAELGRTAALASTHGEVVVVHLNGRGPSKDDLLIDCWALSKAFWGCNARPGGDYVTLVEAQMPVGGTRVRVAFPRLRVHAPGVESLTVEAAGVRATTEPALPVSAIAQHVMRDKLGRVFQRAVLRVVTKALVKRAVSEVRGAVVKNQDSTARVLGWLVETGVRVALDATERADKRAWTTLPARIDVARLWLPAGTHDVAVTAPGRDPVVISGVTVRAGGRVFLTYRTL